MAALGNDTEGRGRRPNFCLFKTAGPGISAFGPGPGGAAAVSFFGGTKKGL